MATQSFKQANSFRQASRGPADIERIIWHTAEIAETRTSAEDVANFFSNPSTDVSAHKVVDNNSVVTCVRDEDIAFHALGDNDQTIGYELAGRASQTFKEWRDDYSLAVIANVAKEAAQACDKYGIPVRWLTDDQLERRIRGLATHDQVSRVFGDDIRDDPGRNFPFDLTERLIEQELAKLRATTKWEVSFVNTAEKRVEEDTRDPDAWVKSHPGALQRGRIVIVPKN